VIVLPVIVINKTPGLFLSWLNMTGMVVWFFGFYFEVKGDAQLSQFIKNPANKGKLMQSGLWAYTRHPNYFGEVILWWGIWLLSISTPNSWFTVLGPLTITILILKVSGIPMLEKKMAENPDFAEYKRRVSAFFPLPPRNI
jgi:steroid 5-alpha reductase family enzyme